MFHTHAPLPRGHFAQQNHEVSSCSYTLPEAGCFNEIKMQGKKCKWISRNAQYGIGRLFPEGVTSIDWSAASGITERLASHAGTSHRSPKCLPSLSSGHVGQESAMWLPSGWQGRPNLPPRTPEYWVAEWLSDWVTEWLSGSLADWLGGWVAEWLSGWVTEWLSDWMTEWLNDWMILLNGGVAEWLSGWLTEWRSDSVAE